MPEPAMKRYTVEEFYSLDLPERCELINGLIYINGQPIDYIPEPKYMAPAPSYIHQSISANVSYQIMDYIVRNKGKCRMFSAPADVKISDRVIQPDIFVTCSPDKIDGRYHNGAPDWVIEILSPSTMECDFKEKLEIYKKGGVREYWIIDPDKEVVIVYFFENPVAIEFYKFSDEIPVRIYSDSPEQLFIRLSGNI